MRHLLLVVLLGLFVVLTGCGGDDRTAAGSTDPVTVELAITDDRADPDVQRIDITEGAEVTVHVTSDAAAEVHVHGFDEYVHLAKPGTGSVTFIADQTGVFDIETHDTGILLGQLAVR